MQIGIDRSHLQVPPQPFAPQVVPSQVGTHGVGNTGPLCPRRAASAWSGNAATVAIAAPPMPSMPLSTWRRLPPEANDRTSASNRRSSMMGCSLRASSVIREMRASVPCGGRRIAVVLASCNSCVPASSDRFRSMGSANEPTGGDFSRLGGATRTHIVSTCSVSGSNRWVFDGSSARVTGSSKAPWKVGGVVTAMRWVPRRT